MKNKQKRQTSGFLDKSMHEQGHHKYLLA